MIGGLWKVIVESKNDHITYEGLASIAKGQKIAERKVSAWVGYLWAHGAIDVVPPAPIDAGVAVNVPITGGAALTVTEAVAVAASLPPAPTQLRV